MIGNRYGGDNHYLLTITKMVDAPLIKWNQIKRELVSMWEVVSSVNLATAVID